MELNKENSFFFQSHKGLLNEKIMKEFLSFPPNSSLLSKYINEPSEQTRYALDIAFKQFFFKAKSVKYLSRLIHFYSIDLCRKYLNVSDKEKTILDSIAMQTEIKSPHYFKPRTLADVVINDSLANALRDLTKKQAAVLNFIYFYGYSTKSIAQYYNDSPQNISKLHKTALRKIREYMEGDLPHVQ